MLVRNIWGNSTDLAHNIFSCFRLFELNGVFLKKARNNGPTVGTIRCLQIAILCMHYFT